MADLTYVEYTNAQLLGFWRQADVEVAAGGQSRAVRGQVLTRADAAVITEKIKFYQDLVNKESRSSGSAVGYSSHGRC